MAVTAKFDFSNSSVANSGFLVVESPTVTGSKGTSGGITFNLLQAFSSASSNSGLIEPAGSPYYTDFNEQSLERYWVLSSGAVGIGRFEGFTPGTSHKFRYMSPNATTGRPINVNDGTSNVDVTSVGGTNQTPEAPKEIISIADGSGYITHTYSIVSTNALLMAVTIEPASLPTISNVDGDNAVNQYQLANINVADFAETITSVLADGVACVIAENDPTDDVIQVRFPGSVATGTIDVVVSGATETDTISGVTFTQTHPILANDALPCDSNSYWKGQGWAPGDEDVYTKDTGLPYQIDGNGDPIDPAVTFSWKAPYTSLADVAAANALGNDVNDIWEAPEGVTGTFEYVAERLLSDATLVTWTTTFTVSNGVISVGEGLFRDLFKSASKQLFNTLFR